MKYLFYDVETPNRYNDSICAIGWALYDGNAQLAQAYQLIDPRAPFDAFNTRLHGVGPADVTGAPTIAEYWRDKLGDMMADAIVIAHNAGFDMSVTAKALAAEGVEMPQIRYCDSLPAFRALYPGKSCKLTDLAARFGYSYQAHNAGADATILARVMRAACLERGYADFSGFFEGARVAAQAARPAPPEESADGDGMSYEEYMASVERIIDNARAKRVDLSGIHFGFHGFLSDPFVYRKNGLDRIVEALGGVYHKGVSRKLDYYVCFDENETNTVQQARSIAQDGRYYLKIIDTAAFLSLIGYGDGEPDRAGPDEIRSRKQRDQLAREAAEGEAARARAMKAAQRAELRAEREAERAARRAERQALPPRGREVRQIDGDGNIVGQFPTISAAAKAAGTNTKSIHDVLNGRQRTAGGYRWEAVESD